MTITEPERHALKDALLGVYRENNRALKPRGGKCEWPTDSALADELAKKLSLTRLIIQRLFRIVNPTANPGEKHLLDPLSRYAGFSGGFAEFRCQLRQALTREIAGDTQADRLQGSHEILQELRQSGGNVSDPLRELLVYDRTGNDDFMKAFVDLAHLNGYYGQLLAAYVARIQLSGSTDDIIFGMGVLYLRSYLTGDRVSAEKYWETLQRLPRRAGTPAFAHGRWAFAALTQAALQASGAEAVARILADLVLVHPQPSNVAAGSMLPAAYNFFPAGFHFLVCEALFLIGAHQALAEWVARTRRQVQAAQYYPAHNVYSELLDLFEAVALLGTGQLAAAQTVYSNFTPSLDLPVNRWLWDYYEVYCWLADLQFAVAGVPSNQEVLTDRINAFANKYQMPFFTLFVQRITSGTQYIQCNEEHIEVVEP